MSCVQKEHGENSSCSQFSWRPGGGGREHTGTVLGEEAESLAKRQKWWAVQALLGQPRGQIECVMLGGLTANVGVPPWMSPAMEGGLGEHPSEKKYCHPPIPRAQLQQRCIRGRSRWKQREPGAELPPQLRAASLFLPPLAPVSEKIHLDKCRGRVKISLVPTLGPQATSLTSAWGKEGEGYKKFGSYRRLIFFFTMFCCCCGLFTLLYFLQYCFCYLCSGVFGVFALRYVGS